MAHTVKLSLQSNKKKENLKERSRGHIKNYKAYWPKKLSGLTIEIWGPFPGFVIGNTLVQYAGMSQISRKDDLIEALCQLSLALYILLLEILWSSMQECLKFPEKMTWLRHCANCLWLYTWSLRLGKTPVGVCSEYLLQVFAALLQWSKYSWIFMQFCVIELKAHNEYLPSKYLKKNDWIELESNILYLR
jgi:hypothetical protein